MPRMRRLGLSIPLTDFSLAESVDIARRAESLGYTDAWSTEAAAWDGFSPLVALGARTEHMRVGLGIAPAFTRPPTLLAMTAATVQALVSGRFCLGLGASTEAVVGRWMGLEYARPYQRVMETLEVVQRVLHGERVSYVGETVRVQDFQLRLPGGLPTPPPVLLGALGPRMLRLAGAHADGVVLVNVGPRMIETMLQTFWAGADASGRDHRPLDVICRVGVAVDEDSAELRADLRRHIASYGSTRAYNMFFQRQGFETEARAMRAAWEQRDGKAASAAVSDAMLDELFVLGDAERCRARLEAYYAAGVRTVLVMPMSARAGQQRRESILSTIEFAAQRFGRAGNLQQR
jgi:probable F420-dependent oxidoreductase